MPVPPPPASDRAVALVGFEVHSFLTLFYVYIYVYEHIYVLVLWHYSSVLFTGTRRVRVRDIVCDLTIFGC